jgi:two-component system sensor histidine kinase CreC
MALSNLLDNAIEFSPPGAVIELSVKADAENVCIAVRDHGVGVPDYAWPRLGERFYSTARPERAGQPPRKGSGLGLAIVRQVMALHGGELRLSPARPGLRAALCLPAA